MIEALKITGLIVVLYAVGVVALSLLVHILVRAYLEERLRYERQSRLQSDAADSARNARLSRESSAVDAP